MNELVCGLWLGQDCSLAVAALALAVLYFVCKGRVRVVCVEVKRDRGSFVDGVYLSGATRRFRACRGSAR